MDNSAPLTFTVLGCGTLGTAILSGVLSAIELHKSESSTSATDEVPVRLPSKFTACVRREASGARIIETTSNYKHSVQVFVGDNVSGVKEADIVLLGCKPFMCRDVLTADGMQEALEGKLLISICAGVKISDLKQYAGPSTRVVRVMPNTASKIRESMTIISAAEDVNADDQKLVTWIFSQIGKAVVLPEKNMDVSTALCGSGPAFYALMLEAMADGGVLMGLPRAEAQLMAAQTMKGTASLVLSGLHPTILREQVSTPGGCTISGLTKLEDGNVRSTIARTIEDATNVAGGLGSKK
ncbi:pyrroline-5-carboxylate reductase dimerization-domain-containing protein [Geopyxis carbonaria]|nr:pyrroline-5-carboxylate reductase dimerization-domain-containing protein [Geopyxis carbonaria]